MSVLPEHAVRYPGQARRLEAHGCLERPDVTGMHTEALPCSEVVGRDFPGELEPGSSLPLEALEDEALAAEDGAAESLLQRDSRLDTWRAAQPTMAVDDVL